MAEHERIILDRMLVGAGYGVRMAADGFAAVRAAMSMLVDVILLEAAMPTSKHVSPGCGRAWRSSSSRRYSRPICSRA